jgi:hypothetical protein
MRVGLRTGILRLAARQVHAQRAVLGHEQLLDLDRLRAGRAHAKHVPVVDDLEILARHEAHAVVDHGVPVLHRHREHVPARAVDAARKVPVAVDDEAAVDLARAALRVRDARGDQRVRVFLPNFGLRALVVQREHPVVYREVRHVPSRGRAAATDLGRQLEHRHPGQLHAAPALGLRHAQQTIGVELGFGLGQQRPHVLCARGALAQPGHHLSRARQGLVVADFGEIARCDRRLRRRCAHAVASLRGIFE